MKVSLGALQQVAGGLLAAQLGMTEGIECARRTLNQGFPDIPQSTAESFREALSETIKAGDALLQLSAALVDAIETIESACAGIEASRADLEELRDAVEKLSSGGDSWKEQPGERN